MLNIDLLEEEENERQKKEENERIELERLRKEDELMKVIFSIDIILCILR